MEVELNRKMKVDMKKKMEVKLNIINFRTNLHPDCRAGVRANGLSPKIVLHDK